MSRPRVILKFATSLDGCFDDVCVSRHVFSSPEDRAEVLELRGSSDAILIGAETLRRDDPSLLVTEDLAVQRLARGLEAQPIRVVLTLSAKLDLGLKFFTTAGRKLVYTTKQGRDNLMPDVFGLAEVIVLTETDNLPLELVLADLSARGVSELLVEGGPGISELFLKAKVVDKLRIALAPYTLEEGPRLTVEAGVLFC